MAKITPVYAAVEMSNGFGWEDVRIILADRLALEKTAKARGWDVEHHPQQAASFMAWAALTRLGEYSETFEHFLNATIDVQLDDAKETGDVDPTSSPTREVSPEL